MKQVIASSPGKVILSGDYAVLAGAPALSAAVNRRAVTTIEVLPGETSLLRTPGLNHGEWQFTTPTAGALEWSDEPPSRVAQLIAAAIASLDVTLPAVGISIDTRAFYADKTGEKLGLGSSAAAMTSTIHALCELIGRPHSETGVAAVAHGNMQGGGSGVDIATSTLGGLICYTRNEPVRASRQNWPAGLEWAVLWSGHSSKTQDMVGKLDDRCWTSASGEALVMAAHDVAARWAGTAEDLLPVLQTYADCLLRFGIDQGVGIFDAGHDKLFDLAKDSGVVYKPSGAGGGDIGVVFACDRHRVRAFCAGAEEHGFQALDLSLDTTGVECREVKGQ